ncbi:MAG: hypothetical protein IPJ38_21465 [Dechloromonas sp.]|uniref:Uncharacterized protein n=1 Tax=Candidatus Dechloromonas phosphorivorans TaxID=2899244 RepID=A0A935MV33_9RHOO|nr:hypothetical protein [Candidatus Dechloromonas phosphorivorans]
MQVLIVAAHVRSEFTNDLGGVLFVAKLDALIAERDQAIAQSVSDWLPLLTRMDQHGLAETRCQVVIEAFCERGVPQGIANFLRQHRYKVLLQVQRNMVRIVPPGKSNNNAVIDSLLWSIQPKTRAQDRKRLSRMLPVMPQLLSKGMERIKVSEEVRVNFLIPASLQTALAWDRTGAIRKCPSLGVPAIDPGLFAWCPSPHSLKRVSCIPADCI